MFVGKIHQEAAHQFIHQGRFSGSTRTRNSKYRNIVFSRHFVYLLHHRRCHFRIILRCGDQTRNRRNMLFSQMIDLTVQHITYCIIGTLHQIVDHSLQTKCTAIIRVVQTRDPVILQFFDLGKQDRSSSTTENLNMRRTLFLQ
ncbi:hypothetical protein D3C86_1374950 [compost metagenome]